MSFFPGEQVTPGDFSLNPDGPYTWPGDPAIGEFWDRDGVTQEPPADFYAFFYADRVETDTIFGPCNYFVVAGPGTSATVRFSQSFDVGAEYGGSYDWISPVTMTVSEGRTRIMSLSPLFGPALFVDGAALLRIEVLSGTLELDTVELQLEPPDGLLMDSGTWEWSDWVDAKEYSAQPLQKTTYFWLNTANASGYGASPDLAALNGVYAEALTVPDADPGTTQTTRINPVQTFSQPNFGFFNLQGEYAFWWNNLGGGDYGPTHRHYMTAITYWWDEYPALFHDQVGYVNIHAPNDEDFPPSWSRAATPPGERTYEFHPDDEWQTIGWYANSGFGISNIAYNQGPATDHPPEAYTLDAISVYPGSLITDPGAVPGSPVSTTTAYPMPAPMGSSPTRTWSPYNDSAGNLAGYTAPPVGISIPAAGSHLTMIMHGALGELTSYPFGAGAGAGVKLDSTSSARAYIRLQPPRVRWRSIVWIPSDEAYIEEVPGLPPGYFLDPNANLDGLGLGADVNFA